MVCPAGKIDKGEDIKNGLLREIFEETAIKLDENQINFIVSLYVRFSTHDLFFHLFKCQLNSQPEVTINPDEHKDYIWINPIEALNINHIHGLEESIRRVYNC